MKYDDIKTFKQSLESKEYEDKLSQYFKLHYDLLHSYNDKEEYKIGEIYYIENKGACDDKYYIVITHQLIDMLAFVNIIYDICGNLIYPHLSGSISINDLKSNKYKYIGTYDVFLKDKSKRIKIGLDYEKRTLEKKLDFLNKELNKL